MWITLFGASLVMAVFKKVLDKSVSIRVIYLASSLTAIAISLAGHLGLDNLILIYDNNRITVDGSIDNCFTEDTSAKLIAQGWDVIDVYDGSNDVSVPYWGILRLRA